MKILSNNQILPTFQHESKAKTQPSDYNEFNAVLKDTLENTKTAALAPMQTTFISSLAGVQPPHSSVPDQQFALNGIEDMINLLDQYHEKLSDPQVTLKKIDPIINELVREMDDLAPVLESLPDDGELKNILNQTLVTASLEISKFYRGDYISA